jgi:hypothetical protein
VIGREISIVDAAMPGVLFAYEVRGTRAFRVDDGILQHMARDG